MLIDLVSGTVYRISMCAILKMFEENSRELNVKHSQSTRWQCA